MPRTKIKDKDSGEGILYGDDGPIHGNEIKDSGLPVPQPLVDLELAHTLRLVLEATRVKRMVGYAKGRCLSPICDRPHVAFKPPCKCPCHAARELLKEMGIEVAE